MPLPATLAILALAACGLWLTRHWGRSPWRWIVLPLGGLTLAATLLAYASGIPPWLVAVPGMDKVFHVLLVGGAAFSLNLWFGGRRWPGPVPAAIAGGFVLMTADEVLQGLSPARSLDGLDWLANLAGLALAWWLSPAPDSDQTG